MAGTLPLNRKMAWPLQPVEDNDANDPEARRGSFPTTQWSMILRARTGEDPGTRSALESLCQLYWNPLFVYLRSQGRTHHEAEDLTQQFLAHLLAANGLQRVNPERGRFRAFLLAGLRNFHTSEWRRTRAAKRGGGLAPVELDPSGSGEPGRYEPVDPDLTPEQAFDRSWAQSVIDHAVRDLRDEYATTGRAKVFEAIAPLIWGNDSNDDFAGRAAAIGLNVNSFRVALHRARTRLGDRVRALVADTVSDPAEIDAELHYLIEAMGGGRPLP